MADYFEERGVVETTEQERMEIDRSNLLRLLADFNMFSEIGTPNQLAPPASKVAVEGLAQQKIERNGGQCLICLKEYEVNEFTKVMPCKHQFHTSCILAWLAKTNSCPLCRYELPTDDVVYEAFRKEKIRAKQREDDINNLHNSMFT